MDTGITGTAVLMLIAADGQLANRETDLTSPLEDKWSKTAKSINKKINDTISNLFRCEERRDAQRIDFGRATSIDIGWNIEDGREGKGRERPTKWIPLFSLPAM
jgi:hypothetical protein